MTNQRAASVVILLAGCSGTDGLVLESADMAPSPDLKPITHWVKQAGGDGTDQGLSVAALPGGEVLMLGTFEGAATFGRGEANETTLLSAGDKDFFLARYAADGALGWVRRAGGAGRDVAWGVAPAPGGDCVVAGYFAQTATFGQGEPGERTLVGRGTSSTAFVARYDGAGRLQWVSTTDGDTGAEGYGIAVRPDGSFVGSGLLRGQVTLGDNEATLTSSGDYDGLWAVYDEAGRVIQAKVIGGSGYDSVEDVETLGDSGWAVTGAFSDTVVFGRGEPNETTLVSEGGWDIFVARYGSAGDLRWARALGSTWANDVGEGVAALADGSIVISGQFGDTLSNGTGQPSITSAGDNDFFAARYDADGRLAWLRRAGGPGYDKGKGKIYGLNGNILLAGSFGGTAIFGPGEPRETALVSAGDLDAFFAELDPSGSLVSVTRAGGPGFDRGMSLALSGGTPIYVGFFTGSATFAPGQPNERTLYAPAGSTDVFLFR